MFFFLEMYVQYLEFYFCGVFRVLEFSELQITVFIQLRALCDFQ